MSARSTTATSCWAALACVLSMACVHPRRIADPPCRPGDACEPRKPPESEEEQWVHVENALAEAVSRVRAACGSGIDARYEKESWENVPYARAPSVLAVRASELPVEQAMTELAEVCAHGAEDDKAAVRAIKTVIIRYVAGGGPGELGADGALIVDLDPMSAPDPYRLRKQLGWERR